MADIGAQSMVAPLRRVLTAPPGAAMAGADPAVWHYATALDDGKLRANHAGLEALLRAADVEILQLDIGQEPLADAVFTHDPSLVTAGGAVLLNMGKPLRTGEVAAHRSFYETAGIPILGEIAAPGSLEGGDCVWLRPDLLLVGLGFRSNEDGVRQLRRLLDPLGVTVMAFDLPVYLGREACLHLMSVISLLDHDLALVYLPLFPTRLLQLLEAEGVTCLAAPEDEFLASAGLTLNVLALAPRHCVMIEGWPKTAALMRQAGCRLETFPGDELCLKAEGGPTCLTRPILRA
ncbi:MAG TPA: arginine deiminase family protein [Kiloniellaceae bacterium]|nr:arginine deiminase family protein [Kiloniellaceae bacterium]